MRKEWQNCEINKVDGNQSALWEAFSWRLKAEIADLTQFRISVQVTDHILVMHKTIQEKVTRKSFCKWIWCLYK